jgi:hypothetical protein
VSNLRPRILPLWTPHAVRLLGNVQRPAFDALEGNLTKTKIDAFSGTPSGGRHQPRPPSTRRPLLSPTSVPSLSPNHSAPSTQLHPISSPQCQRPPQTVHPNLLSQHQRLIPTPITLPPATLNSEPSWPQGHNPDSSPSNFPPANTPSVRTFRVGDYHDSRSFEYSKLYLVESDIQ